MAKVRVAAHAAAAAGDFALAAKLFALLAGPSSADTVGDAVVDTVPANLIDAAARFAAKK